jgi:hypothetical protein
MANTIAHSNSIWNRDPAVIAVVIVPGPINAAEITDQRITLEILEEDFN